MKLKYEIEVLELDGDLIAVPLGGDDAFRGVIHMNETTADILNTLKSDTTEDALVEKLKSEYDATAEQLHASVEKVLSTLREYALLIE